MKSLPRASRTLAALSAAAVLTLAGCAGDSSDDGGDDKATFPTSGSDGAPDAPEATDVPEATEDQEGEASSGGGADAELPLSEELSAQDPPAWGLPLVDGWSVPQELQSGVFQIGKEGSETVVTAYQLADPSGSDAEQAARDWLDNYHAQVADSAGASDVTDPTYDTVVLDSTQGTMEFVAQDLAYGTPSGTRFRSFYVARWIDGYLLGLQYAAPEDEWSEDEWALLTEQGLKLTL
ncbi:hypothetical protein [Nocardioides solisilvae]|uniref:hypothetical protein n=1 Tax=Nocardioides solisilvae TaxID=1542435 RepID=UPI000D74AD61|nr:hypothetical protein [Nocardioides solisilvae]